MESYPACKELKDLTIVYGSSENVQAVHLCAMPPRNGDIYSCHTNSVIIVNN